jgi:hypothetical protein
MILLNEAPKLKSKGGKRKGKWNEKPQAIAYFLILVAMVAILGMLMVVFLFSYILSIFRSKYQGYPYRYAVYDYLFSININLFYFSFLIK